MADPQRVEDDLDLVARSNAAPSIAPGELADELKPLIDGLDLGQNVEELREHGYTIVRDIAPPELMDELREAIHQCAQDTEGKWKGRSCGMLLGRSRVIDEVLTLPKLLALAEFSLGKGFRASLIQGSIMDAGSARIATTLHADQSWLPVPFPEHNCMLTFCVPCEGMTEEGGATVVVPGSAALRRHMTPEDFENVKTVPLEVEKCSAAVWDGSVWHATGERTIPGTRTVLHAAYQRLYTQPIEDYSHLLEDDEYLASAPDAIRSLLGADLGFATSTVANGGPDMDSFHKMTVMARR